MSHDAHNVPNETLGYILVDNFYNLIHDYGYKFDELTKSAKQFSSEESFTIYKASEKMIKILSKNITTCFWVLDDFGIARDVDEFLGLDMNDGGF